MGILESASYMSVSRGYDYYTNKKVKNFKKESKTTFSAIVNGRQDYEVFIDIEHPRKSKCNCPHANGKRVICKHMVATFFKAFPKEAEDYKEWLDMVMEEEKKENEEIEFAIEDYISSCSREELEFHLFDLLYSVPDWKFDEFINNTINISHEKSEDDDFFDYEMMDEFDEEDELLDEFDDDSLDDEDDF